MNPPFRINIDLGMDVGSNGHTDRTIPGTVLRPTGKSGHSAMDTSANQAEGVPPFLPPLFPPVPMGEGEVIPDQG